MKVDTKQLRELAYCATPGPWHLKERCDNAAPGEACGILSEHRNRHGHIVGIFQSDAHDECSHPVFRSNAEFIAAANPTAVIELLAELERLSALVAELRNQRDALIAAPPVEF